jgi:Uma2 family endonuclease
MTIQLLRRPFTVAEYRRMAQAGIFTEDDRVELLGGEVAQMTPIGSRHAACVTRLNHLFVVRLQGRAQVNVQNPIHLSERSEPQPDIALLRPRSDFYAPAHPGPADVILLVEVAETSSDVDRTVKVPLYARAGIPEVWLVTLAEDGVEVYRRPTAEGYQELQSVGRGGQVTPQTFEDVSIEVAEILGYG